MENKKKLLRRIQIKLIFSLVIILFLIFVKSEKLVDYVLPQLNIVENIKGDYRLQVQSINQSNKLVNEVFNNLPQIRTNIETIKNQPELLLNNNRQRIIDLPSLLVYFEKIGNLTGTLVKEINIPNIQAVQNSQKIDIVISANGSYSSLSNYVNQIQMNTKEYMKIEEFELIEDAVLPKTYNIQLKISI